MEVDESTGKRSAGIHDEEGREKKKALKSLINESLLQESLIKEIRDIYKYENCTSSFISSPTYSLNDTNERRCINKRQYSYL